MQLEFHSKHPELGFPPGCSRVRLRTRRETNAIEYVLRLSKALRRFNLTHQVYDVLAAAVKLQAAHGYATKPAICEEIGCTYNTVVLHFFRNPGWFREVVGDDKPARYELTPDALKLMARIKNRVEKTS